MRFNPNRHFAEVYGLPGVAYQQDGRYFLKNGDLAQHPEAAEEDAAPPEPMPVAVAAPEPEAIKSPGRPTRAEEAALKLQMEAYGEEWQGVPHARKFLGIK